MRVRNDHVSCTPPIVFNPDPRRKHQFILSAIRKHTQTAIAMADADAVLQSCLRKAKQYSANWKLLGLLLQVQKNLLDVIERNNPRDVDTCMMEMLDTWLRNNPENPETELDDALMELQRTTQKLQGKKHLAL